MNIWERAALYELVAADLRAGLPGSIVAKKHGISPATIYGIRDHFGIAPAPRGPKPQQAPYDPEAARLWQEHRKATELRRTNIIALFEDGETLASIGEQFGITRERVRQIVRAAGMKPRLAQGKERRAAIATQMRDEAMTAKMAAERFGFDPADAHRIAHEFGFILTPEPRLIDEPRFAEMAEKVRGGMSIRNAAGSDHPTEAALARYCEEHGIKSVHGRWRPRQERAALVRVMRASHRTWAQVAEAVSAVEGYITGPAAIHAWSQRHMARGEYTPPKRPERPAAERRARGAGKGHGPRVPVAVCDEVREAARLNYGKAPASEIAKAHGVTRNVIIGHWFRLRRAGLLPLQNEAAA
jgi:hypothetical protein